MCSCCSDEYYDAIDMRWHMEKSGDEECELLDCDGIKIQVEDIFKEVRRLIKEGAIVGIKGIGGFSLVCDARLKVSIDWLRIRKGRKSKPFALMIGDIKEVENYCEVSDIERNILKGNQKPIVLLRKKNEELPKNIAFDSKDLGIVLPYAPLHFPLFDEDIKVLVFTSGNRSGEIIEYKNEDAINNLKGIADYFLVHYKEIKIPLEDSIVKVISNKEQVIRFGRGYAPLYINTKNRSRILACGSQFKNTFAISTEESVFISQFIGDLNTNEAKENFKRSLKYVMDLYDLNMDIIAYDMHPNYWHQEFINEYTVRKFGTFHHHAHIVSCLVDNGVRDKVIGIAFDGIGYGRDGKLWGGEFLICDYKCFKRVGHLNYMEMPGEDSATINPWVMGVSLVKMAYEGNKAKVIDSLPDDFKEKDINVVLSSIEGSQRENLCSSMGSLFDGVASLLGFTERGTYEEEAAVYLENLALAYKEKGLKKVESYVYGVRFNEGIFTVDTNTMIKQILLDLESKKDNGEIALRLHETIIELSKDICERLRNKYKINKIALSGRCFQNDLLLKGIYHKLSDSGFEVLTHKKIPCDDSGISVGQYFIANEILRD